MFFLHIPSSWVKLCWSEGSSQSITIDYNYLKQGWGGILYIYLIIILYYFIILKFEISLNRMQKHLEEKDSEIKLLKEKHDALEKKLLKENSSVSWKKTLKIKMQR